MEGINPFQVLVREVKRKIVAPKGRGWRFRTNVSAPMTPDGELSSLRAMKRDVTIEMDEHRPAFDESGRPLKGAKAVYTRNK